MADRIWLGTATAVAGVRSWTFGGTWEATDIIRAQIGYRIVDFVAGDTVIADILDDLVEAFNELDEDDYPEFTGETGATAYRSGSDFLLTANTPGVPVIATLTPLETNGDPADDQEIESGGVATTGTIVTASSGPNHWDTAANWTGGAVPVDSDNVYFENSSVSVLYGLEQSDIQPTLLHFRRSYTGTVGLPRWNAEGGYAEYRTDYLQIEPTTLIVEADSGRIKVDATDGQTAVVVLHTGSPLEEDVPAFLFKGTHASNTLEANKGSVGVAIFAGETATLTSLRVGYTESILSDVDLVAGAGLTLTTMNQSGGKVDLSKSPTTVVMIDGLLTVRGSTNATTLTCDEGEVRWLSSGTLTTLNAGNKSRIDYARDLSPRTVTNCNVYAGAEINDPFGTVTWTNGLVLVRTNLESVTLNVGNNRTLTVA